MVEPKKVQLMTRLSMMEASETKDALKIVRYSKFDYIRLQVLKVIISITIGLIMILAAYAFYQSEYLLSNIASMDYKSIGTNLLMIYILLIIFFAYFYTSITFNPMEIANNMKKSIRKQSVKSRSMIICFTNFESIIVGREERKCCRRIARGMNK